METGESERWYVPDDIDPVARWMHGQNVGLRVTPYTDYLGNKTLRLVERSGKMLGIKNRHLARLGIFCVAVQGESYYVDGCTAGDFSLGAKLLLRQEPDNIHDPRAVAVFDATGRYKAGYYNRGKARQVGTLLDAGGLLQAFSMRGEAAGVPTEQVFVFAAAPYLTEQVLQPIPADWVTPRTAAH